MTHSTGVWSRRGPRRRGRYANPRLGQLAECLGVRTPSLYRHVTSQDDLNRRISPPLPSPRPAMPSGPPPRATPTGRASLPPRGRSATRCPPPRPVRGHHRRRADRPDRGRRDPGTRLRSGGPPHVPQRTGGQRARAARLRSAFPRVRHFQAAPGFPWSADVNDSCGCLITFVDRGPRAICLIGARPPARSDGCCDHSSFSPPSRCSGPTDNEPALHDPPFIGSSDLRVGELVGVA